MFIEILLLFTLALIVFAYVGYPLIGIIMGTFGPRPVKKDESIRPQVTLMIAAYNEEAFIATKIENSLELEYPREKLKIVVVSDGSTDRTDEIVKSYSDRGVELVRVEGRVGKTEARNVAVKMDSSEIIIFSDATAIYQKDVVLKLIRNFADPEVGMVSGSLKYFDNSESEMGLSTKLYWKYETFIKRTQSKLFTLTGAIGCINAFRRELYTALPAHIIEDFTEPLAIVSKGYRVVFEEEAVAFERTTQNGAQEFKMRVRVIRGGMSGALYAIGPLGLKRKTSAMIQLVTHKVLRWLVPVMLIATLLLSLVSTALGSSFGQFLLFAQLICYGISSASLLKLLPGPLAKIGAIPAYFLVVNAASLKALYLTLTSELAPTWETNVY